MKFEEALKAMREGKKVKRPDFIYPIIFEKDEELFFAIYEDGYELIYWLEHNDIIAEDWEIVDD